MISAFGWDWWPEGVRRPGLRLAAGVILAPMALAAVATAIAFVVFGLNLPDGASVAQATLGVALTAVAALGAMAISVGLAAVAGLWAARRRSVWAFLAAGAAAGAVFAIAATLLSGTQPPLPTVLILAALGAGQFAVLRAIAGVRARD